LDEGWDPGEGEIIKDKKLRRGKKEDEKEKGKMYAEREKIMGKENGGKYRSIIML
jgi:hypothetical protein